MKIAICGAHAVGKSTLAEVLASALPDVRVIAEPYEALVEEGCIFEDPPGVEDFLVQLERSLSTLEVDRENVIFDRAPADFLAYLAVIQHREGEDPRSRYWNDVAAAMKRLDLIVYVPVERLDRIEVPLSEYPRLRRRADEELRRLLVDDELGASDKVLEVRGSVAQRAEQVLARLARPQVRATRTDR